jgi:hypothetical protein
MPNITSHRLPRRMTASGFNIDLRVRPFKEGKLRILSPIAGEADLYLVRFDGEQLPVLRFVHSEWQCDPVRTLQILNDYWRLASDPVLSRAGS